MVSRKHFQRLVVQLVHSCLAGCSPLPRMSIQRERHLFSESLVVSHSSDFWEVLVFAVLNLRRMEKRAKVMEESRIMMPMIPTKKKRY